MSCAGLRLTLWQPDKEIAGCINDIGIPFTSADLLKPNPQQIQMVFEWFAELLMNITRDTVEPGMRAAADDVGGDYPDIVPTDTRNLMGFFGSLKRLMMEVSFRKVVPTFYEYESLHGTNSVRSQRLCVHGYDQTDTR